MKKIIKVKDKEIKELAKLFDGDLDLVLFFLKWIEKGQNATQAYLELHPNVDPASARVLGSRVLARVNIGTVLETYGLGLEKYLKQLQEGIEANRVISAVPDVNGEAKDATGKSYSFIEVPDHRTREVYHSKLGKLLGVEKENSQQATQVNVLTQLNFDKYKQ